MLKAENSIAVKWINSVDSTNAEIMRSASDLPDKFTLAALLQHSGRGQGDHFWHSEKGKNLTFSVLLKYEGKRLAASEQCLLNYAASLAVTDFLTELGINAGIKSPNDILVNGKKICGMLIQNSVCGGIIQQSIVGFGINVNEIAFPLNLGEPTSISQLTGKTYDLKKCLRAFLRHFFRNFDAIWNEAEHLEIKYREKLLTVLERK